MSLSSARRELAKAQASLAAADEAVDVADDAVDYELASIGWRRAVAVASPGVRVYENALHQGTILNRSELLAALEQQAPAA